MSTWRKIDTRIWNDRKFMGLSGDAKLAFLFILTHPSMTSLGAMRATIEGLASELGNACLRHKLCHTVGHNACHTVGHNSRQPDALSDGIFKPSKSDEYLDAIDELIDSGLIQYDRAACFICAPNFVKYNPPSSVNMAKGYTEALERLPECDGRNAMVKRVVGISHGMPHAIGHAIRLGIGHAIGHAVASPRATTETETETDIKRSSSGDDSGPATDEIQDDQAQKSANKTPSARQKTDWIMELWNDKADARLPRCSVWSAKRRGLAAAQLCDHPDRADWEKAVAAVNASTFCTGQGPRGWLASIDWLLRPETLTRLIEGQFADGEGKTRIEARHGQSSKNAGIGSDGPEIVKPTPKSAGFWRHPDDPEPGENDRGRSSEWEGLLESLAGDMDPDRFTLFEDELTTCEAISDSDIWLIVGGNYARAAMFAFRDEPLEICGRDLHVAIDDTEEYATKASLARLPY